MYFQWRSVMSLDPGTACRVQLFCLTLSSEISYCFSLPVLPSPPPPFPTNIRSEGRYFKPQTFIPPFISPPDVVVLITVVSGYFQHLGMLNQLLTLSHQLNSDAFNLTNHKYLAHQTALLYVSTWWQILFYSAEGPSHSEDRWRQSCDESVSPREELWQTNYLEWQQVIKKNKALY